mmetsp:Transcript_12449/g.18357  ORF Transcript_12449/g.18357 Transcript_12449/m.18357 type:complete len:310 (+) Transcript_12449:199-1128(+)
MHWFISQIFARSNSHRPWVVHLSILYIHNAIPHALGHGPNVVPGGHHDVLAHVVDLVDRGHDGRCARTKHLQQPPFLGGLHDLGHGHEPLLHLELTPAPGQLKNTVTGDSWQDVSPGEGRSGQDLSSLLLLAHKEQVHGPNLRHTVLLAVQPENLGEALRHGFLLRGNGGRVVPPHLGSPHPAGPGSHVDGVGQQGHWLEALGVVGAHRGQDDEHLDLLRGPHTQVRVGADGSWAYVHGEAFSLGDPVFVHHQQFLETLQQPFFVQRRHGQASHGVIHPFQVLVWAKEADVAQGPIIRLHAFKALQSIM